MTVLAAYNTWVAYNSWSQSLYEANPGGSINRYVRTCFVNLVWSFEFGVKYLHGYRYQTGVRYPGAVMTNINFPEFVLPYFI